MNSIEVSCLTFFDYVPILGLGCYLVRIFLPVCNAIYLTGQICRVSVQFTDKISEHFKDVIDQFQVFLDEIFYVKMNVKYENLQQSNKSESLKKIYGKITSAIENRFDIINFGLSAKVVISILILIWVLYSSYAYRKKFLKYDNFDNAYISKELNKIDNKRAMANLETIFPLYPEEKIKYLTRDSIFLSKIELLDILKNYLILLLFTFQMISISLLDYLLYSMANIFTKILTDYSQQDQQHMFYIKETGNERPNILIESINNATNLEALAPIKSLLECKKNNAFYPLTSKYRLILFHLLILCSIYFTRGYLKRTLSLICSFYYPERKNKRNIHLYLTILRTRANLFLFLARGLKQTAFEDKRRLKINLCERFLADNPTLTLWLTRLKILNKKDFCFVCGLPGVIAKDDQLNKSLNKLYSCTSEQCESTYCLNCASDHSFRCVLCNSRIIKKHKGLKPINGEDEDNYFEISDSDDEWQPFYFEFFKLKNKKKVVRGVKLKNFYQQLDELSNLKQKEEKKFLAYLCSTDHRRIKRFKLNKSSISKFNFLNFLKQKLKSNKGLC